jgi:hypothetical protein
MTAGSARYIFVDLAESIDAERCAERKKDENDDV